MGEERKIVRRKENCKEGGDSERKKENCEEEGNLVRRKENFKFEFCVPRALLADMSASNDLENKI